MLLQLPSIFIIICRGEFISPLATAATDTQTKTPLEGGGVGFKQRVSHLTRCQLQSSSNPGGDFDEEEEAGEIFPEGKMFFHYGCPELAIIWKICNQSVVGFINQF